VQYLYKSKNLPESFRKQKSRFLKDLNIDSVYSEMLKTAFWYDEVRAIQKYLTLKKTMNLSLK